MKIAIVANGHIQDPQKILPKLLAFDKVIAVDGGLRNLRELSIKPFLIIGDFDSATKEDLAFFHDVPLEKHSSDKDDSDTALAVKKSFEMGAQQVTLFGALGGRIDHTLANLCLLSHFHPKLSIETETETVYAIHDLIKQTSYPGQVISLFPLGEKAEKVTTKGLKWELKDKTLDNSFFSLSNVAIDHSFEITVGKGTLICVVQHV